MTAQARLAVVVLNWNGREDTLRCLDSLRGEIGPGDAVIVVDNGSTDGSPAAVKAAHPWAEVIETGANLGYAGGNNAGMRAALDRGFVWVLLLNNDTTVEPGALGTLHAHGEAHPETGALQPLLVTAEDPPRVDSMGLRPLRCFGVQDAGQGAPASSAPRDPVPILGPCGAAALYRVATLRETGLLDEDLFLLCEDLDLAFRVRMAGKEAHVVPEALVRHRRGISGRQGDAAAARRRKFWLQRNTVAMALRYWPPRWMLLGAPLLLWRMFTALRLSESDLAHPCLPLWGRCLAERGASRRALVRAGADRWFA